MRRACGPRVCNLTICVSEDVRQPALDVRVCPELCGAARVSALFERIQEEARAPPEANVAHDGCDYLRIVQPRVQ